MRKLLLCIFFTVLMCSASFSQERISLVEHFTSANCNPCAEANPKVDPIYEANFPRVVVIKYQTIYPEPDIMYYENADESLARLNYYGVSGAPDVYLDGMYKKGFPTSVINATYLKAAYNRDSDWNIDLSYEIIKGSELSIKMEIESLKEQTGNFAAHIVLIEKEINFRTPPGSNREKNFKYVMRKMVPSAEGTILKTNWAENEMFTIEEDIAVPLIYRDLSQLAIVAFIQDNDTRIVAQAAFADSKTFQNTAEVSMTYLRPITENNLIPSFDVKSEDIEVLNSAVIKIIAPDGTSQSYNWTGKLDISESGNIQLPDFPLEIKPGANKYRVGLYYPNSLNNINLFDAHKQTENYITGYYSAKERSLPLIEDFETISYGEIELGGLKESIFVDYDETGHNNIMQSDAAWKLGANDSEGAALFRNFHNSIIGAKTDYYFPNLNVEGENNLTLSYYYAYCPRDLQRSDSLYIHVSTDGGISWKQLIRKNSTELNTIDNKATLTEFVPTKTDDWKQEIISLNEYAGSSSLLIRFRVVNGFNNTLALDQITVSNKPTDLNDSNYEHTFEAYVNNDDLNLSLNFNYSVNPVITLYDISGREMYSEMLGYIEGNTNYQKTITIENLHKGAYFILIHVDGNKYSRKFIKY